MEFKIMLPYLVIDYLFVHVMGGYAFFWFVIDCIHNTFNRNSQLHRNPEYGSYDFFSGANASNSNATQYPQYQGVAQASEISK